MDTKTCFKCKQSLPLDSFYKHSGMSGGRLGKCKECTKKDVRANRAANIDYYRQYDRERASNPDRVAARIAYPDTPEGIAASNIAKQRWSSSNAIKRGACRLVNNSVRDGKIVKATSCECCGVTNKRLEGHHPDYAKPLEVNWLCSKCHRTWHKTNKSING